jgi:hypothetical protein
MRNLTVASVGLIMIGGIACKPRTDFGSSAKQAILPTYAGLDANAPTRLNFSADGSSVEAVRDKDYGSYSSYGSYGSYYSNINGSSSSYQNYGGSYPNNGTTGTNTLQNGGTTSNPTSGTGGYGYNYGTGSTSYANGGTGSYGTGSYGTGTGSYGTGTGSYGTGTGSYGTGYASDSVMFRFNMQCQPQGGVVTAGARAGQANAPTGRATCASERGTIELDPPTQGDYGSLQATARFILAGNAEPIPYLCYDASSYGYGYGYGYGDGYNSGLSTGSTGFGQPPTRNPNQHQWSCYVNMDEVQYEKRAPATPLACQGQNGATVRIQPTRGQAYGQTMGEATVSVQGQPTRKLTCNYSNVNRARMKPAAQAAAMNQQNQYGAANPTGSGFGGASDAGPLSGYEEYLTKAWTCWVPDYSDQLFVDVHDGAAGRTAATNGMGAPIAGGVTSGPLVIKASAGYTSYGYQNGQSQPEVHTTPGSPAAQQVVQALNGATCQATVR